MKVSRQDLVALTEQTLAMFRITMNEKHITLQTTGLEDTLPAVVDPDKVDKVLSNLLSNAVKYTPEGGTIGLKLDTDGRESYSKSPTTDQAFRKISLNGYSKDISRWKTTITTEPALACISPDA